MKKVLFISLLILVVFIAGLFTWRYVNYLRDPDPDKTFLLPRVGLSIIEISSLTAEKTEMSMSVLIKNQMPISFTADSFQYALYMNDAEIIKSRYKKSISLEANDSSWVTLPVTVYNDDIDSLIKANVNRGIDSVEYRMHASFVMDLLLRKKINVNIKRFLPLIRLPELEVNRVEIDSLNFKRAALIIHADLTNNNVFDIKLKDYSYEVQIEDHEWVKGIIKGLTVLKSRTTTALEIPVTISLKEVGKTIGEVLRKGKNVNYELVLKLQVASEVDMLKNSKAIIKSSGTVKSLLKAVKGES